MRHRPRSMRFAAPQWPFKFAFVIHTSGRLAPRQQHNTECRGTAQGCFPSPRRGVYFGDAHGCDETQETLVGQFDEHTMERPGLAGRNGIPETR
jgi:hypothetical protein